MKTISKKLLSVLLAVLMIMSTVPVMALPIFAEGETGSEDTNNVSEELTPAD